MTKSKTIQVQGIDIRISKSKNEDFISLTDIVKGFEGGTALIDNWLRNKNTIEFLAIWEALNNPNFNSLEFEGFKSEAGVNRFTLSVQKWVDWTNAIGIYSKKGRYNGGTHAHKDIAFEFGSWLSPTFKMYLIKEFQRLKEIENLQGNIEWNVKRVLSKVNYKIHTDAIKFHILPKLNIQKDKEWLVYASEADMLNVALFGCTSKEWRENNPDLALNNANIRDFATMNELTVLSNIESLSSIFMKQYPNKEDRFIILKQIVKDQLKSLENLDILNSVRQLTDKTSKDSGLSLEDKSPQ